MRMEKVGSPPAPRKRLKVLLRLIGLLSVPIFVIFAIFAAGVLMGVQRAEAVLDFEARWLGMERPPAAQSDSEGTDETGEPTKTEPSKAAPTRTEPTKAEPTKTEPAKAEPGLPIAEPEPLGGELAELLAQRRVLRIKLMIDPALLISEPDWLSYVDTLVDASAASSRELFGIELRLQGAVLWESAVGGSSEVLMTDLAGRERDGAELLIGLVGRPADGEPTRSGSDVALVFADPNADDHFYRGLLRALASVFGAQVETQQDTIAWQRGSFMSDAPAQPGTIWLDPDNRARVLRSKQSSLTAEAPSEPEREED